MLGLNGISNGCVSFKTYDVFLRAFQSGEVKRLAVVALTGVFAVWSFREPGPGLNR
jgi:hypothetical protein